MGMTRQHEDSGTACKAGRHAVLDVSQEVWTVVMHEEVHTGMQASSGAMLKW